MARTPNASPPDADAFSPAVGRLRDAAAALPEVAESTSYGTPALKLRGKMLCRLKDPGTVVLVCSHEDKAMLMEAAPHIYFETDHYRGYPLVLARMEAIGDAELAHRLDLAWRIQAPKSLLKARGS
jgi:hypothetical protein